MTLHAADLTLGYGPTDVVTGLELTVPEGALTVLVGPNGCGKSTILKGLSGALPARAGRVRLEGRDVADYPARHLARRLAMLPQAPVTPTGLSVKELVARGRYPHRGMFTPWSVADEEAVTQALAAVDLTDLAATEVGTLSGGQRQRAWVALVLAQQAGTILLDEPTTFLDLAHAVDVMRVVRSAAHARGCAVVAVLHDLTIAARFADHLVVVDAGRVVAAGAPADVLEAGLLADVFGLQAQVVDVAGAPAVVPL